MTSPARWHMGTSVRMMVEDLPIHLRGRDCYYTTPLLGRGHGGPSTTLNATLYKRAGKARPERLGVVLL